MTEIDGWKRVKEVFQQALEKPLEERDAFVCSMNDSRLVDEVQRLIRSHESASGFLDSPLHAQQDLLANSALPKDLVKGYELVRQIGAGGYGVVFEAWQVHPPRRVALKILNPIHALSPRLLRRFELESEILAKLQHHGIASVFESGTCHIGQGAQPWFAMEYVDGVSLRDYMQGCNLLLPQKLQFFIRICEAIQYAHSCGVIHRDIKPSNIVVVVGSDPIQPECPHPKILDFGLARTQSSDLEGSMLTASGEIFGTLNYVCPEIVTGKRSTIDQRSDVYSLGVVGFQLLTGKLPHDRSGETIVESLKRIAEESPRRLGQTDRSLRGDLDAIFAKCLQIDASTRYATVQHLIDDLQRHRSREPVLARHPSHLYCAGKFLRRHWGIVSSVGIAFGVLLVGLWLYFAEAQRARLAELESRYEAEKATAINSFLTNDFLIKMLADAGTRPANDPSSVTLSNARAMIGNAASKVNAMFGSRPKIEAAVRNEVGTIYYTLGHFEDAQREYRSAYELWSNHCGTKHPDTLKAINNLGQTAHLLGERIEAERLYRLALAGRIDTLGPSDASTLSTMNNLAELLRKYSKVEEAEKMFREVIELELQSGGADDKTTLTTMSNLGALLVQKGQLAEAVELHRHVFEATARTLGDDHIMRHHSAERLAQTLYRAGQLEESLTLLLSTVDAYQSVFGAGHDRTISSRRILARVYRQLGQKDEALAQLEEAQKSLATGSSPPSETLEKIRKEIDALHSK